MLLFPVLCAEKDDSIRANYLGIVLANSLGLGSRREGGRLVGVSSHLQANFLTDKILLLWQQLARGACEYKPTARPHHKAF